MTLTSFYTGADVNNYAITSQPTTTAAITADVFREGQQRITGPFMRDSNTRYSDDAHKSASPPRAVSLQTSPNAYTSPGSAKC